MKSTNELAVAKWPFFLADALLVGAAALTLWYASSPASPGSVVAAVLPLLFGAMVSLVPFLLEHYWNWQRAEANTRERLASQQQSMARVAAEMGELLSRLENMDGQAPGPSEGGGEIGEQLDETARALGQWQAQLEEREGRFAAEMEEAFRVEGERREEFRRYLDDTLHHFAEFCGRQALAVEEQGLSGAGYLKSPDAGVAGEEIELEDVHSSAPDLSEIEEIESEAEEDSQPQDEPNPRKRKGVASKNQVKSEAGGALFSTTTLVATASIGEADKLYLRGEGPGLDWEEGVPMRFVEVGKWSWTTTDAVGPIQVQVFKNDRDADTSGVLTVEPGQTMSLRPKF